MEEKKEDLGDPIEEPVPETETDVDEIINGDSEESDEELDKKSTKRLFVLLGIIIVAFVLILGGSFLYNKYGPTGAVTLDDLHKMNMDGEGGDNSYMYIGFSFLLYEGFGYN